MYIFDVWFIDSIIIQLFISANHVVVDFFYYYDAIVCTALPFPCFFCFGIWNLAEKLFEI